MAVLFIYIWRLRHRKVQTDSNLPTVTQLLSGTLGFEPTRDYGALVLIHDIKRSFISQLLSATHLEIQAHLDLLNFTDSTCFFTN